MIYTKPIIKEFQRNVDGTDYFVGDVHGRYLLLMNKLKSMNFDFNKDRLFCTGDLIDRGSQNIEMLQLLDEPWFHTVLGNHEDMAYASVFENCKVSTSIWQGHGGEWYMNATPEDKEVANKLIEKVKYLPRIIVVDYIAVVHAELFGDISDYYGNIRMSKLEQLIWGRNRLTLNDSEPATGVEFVVVGHSPQTSINVIGNHIYVDNGFWFRNVEPTIYSAKELRQILKHFKE